MGVGEGQGLEQEGSQPRSLCCAPAACRVLGGSQPAPMGAAATPRTPQKKGTAAGTQSSVSPWTRMYVQVTDKILGLLAQSELPPREHPSISASTVTSPDEHHAGGSMGRVLQGHHKKPHCALLGCREGCRRARAGPEHLPSVQQDSELLHPAA